MKFLKMASILALTGTSVVAEGHADASEGETAFGRQCVSCHVIADADGNVLAGRAAKTGPNLYGMIGQTPGTVDGFRYGPDLVAAGEASGPWTEESLAQYIMDPTAWIRDTTGNGGARSRMSFKVRSPEDAANIAAFIGTFSE